MLYSVTRPNFYCFTLQASEPVLNFNLSKMVLWNNFPQLMLHLLCTPQRGGEGGGGGGAWKPKGVMVKCLKARSGDANVFRCH